MDFRTETYAINFLNKFKQTMGVDITIGELHAILRETGIKPLYFDSKHREVYPRYQLNELLRSDREFHRCLRIVREKQKANEIKQSWNNEPQTTYEPDLSDMNNASDDLLRQQEVYYDLRESKIEDDFKKYGITKKVSKNKQGYRTIEYNFGKNGQGLTKELCVIAKDVEQETKKPFYLCEPHFDILDDVYSFKVVTQDKFVNESYTLNEDEMMIYDYVHIPVMYSTYMPVGGTVAPLTSYQVGYLATRQKLDKDFLIITNGEGYPCEFAKSVIPMNRFLVKKYYECNRPYYKVINTYELVNHIQGGKSVEITEQDILDHIAYVDGKPKKSVKESLNEGISGYKPYDSDEFCDEAARIGEDFINKLIGRLKNASDDYWKYVFMGMIIDFLHTPHLSWGSLFWEKDDNSNKCKGMELINVFNSAYESLKGKGEAMGWKEPKNFEKELELLKKQFDKLMEERQTDSKTFASKKTRNLKKKREALYYQK